MRGSASSPWVCTDCRSPIELTQAAGRCTGCGLPISVIGNDLPVFLPKVSAAVADAYLGLQATSRAVAREAETVRNALRERAAFEPDGPLLRGYAVLHQSLQRLAGHLRLAPDARHVLDALWDSTNAPSATPDTYVDPLPYAVRDWSGLPRANAEIEAIVSQVEKQCLHAVDRESVLVVGAGTGRFAQELLATFKHVTAIEKSIPMALVFDYLQTSDLDTALVDLRDVRTAAEAVTWATLSTRHCARPALVPGSTVAMAVGDALELPLPAASQSVVASIFFTDVAPLRSHLLEVRRVLRPGGLFVHHGPLHFHSRKVTDRYAAEEVRALVKEFGFEPVAESWHPGFHLEREGVMLNTWYDCWSFVARLRAPPLTPRSPEWSKRPLSLATPFTLTTTTTVRPSGERTEAHSIRLEDGTEFEVEEGVVTVLNLVDGQLSFDELADSLATDYALDDDARRGLVHIVERFVENGVLRIGP